MTKTKPPVKTARVPAKSVSRKRAPASATKAAPTKAAARPAVAKPATKEVAKPRLKLVRDSFTMPQQDFDLVAMLKVRALVFHRPAKKSELLRAGLHALQALSDQALKESLNRLLTLKAGRPKKAA